MPDRYYPAILFAIIQKSGSVELDGWIIKSDEIGTFILHKDISVDVKETDEGLIHIVTQERRLYDQSEIKNFLVANT